MRTHLVGATLIALFGSAAGAAAQEPDVIFYSQAALDPAGGQVRAAGPMGQIRIAGGPGVPFEMGVDVLAVEPFDTGKPVAGAPYSAEITTEIVQQLADGNRIERRSTSSVARDGQGRVRREQQVTAIGPILPQGHAQIVTINDPVSKAHYSLDAERKVAIQMPMLFTAKVEGPAGRSFTARAETREFIAVPPVAAAQATDARTEMLGTKEIEGVRAEGTRVTVAIPAGAIGNQAPIEIVNERWYSPELQTVVYSRRADPRFGETTYRLTNIVRAEPPAELFQVPPDFTVEEARGQRIEMRKVLPTR
jgi:hypothetical protein